ncbi:hypothetical protein TNCV_1489421 [Trichonephila clavipes]|nr:hypothetical protein TNCV_1489421 [Trichonephila clavipes]
MKNNSFFPLVTTTEVNRDESQFALSVNAESFVPKVDKTQIVATACFKNKCFLSTALILVKDKYSEWQTFRALLDSGSETCLISNECANKLQLKTERINMSQGNDEIRAFAKSLKEMANSRTMLK